MRTLTNETDLSRCRVIHDDVIAGLRTLPDECAQTVITSPPYWGLRDYGIEPSVWLPADLDGCPHPCAHEWGSGIRRTGGARGQGASSIRLGRSNVRAQEFVRDAGNTCVSCGAWCGALGLEPTPELFVEHIVTVFREVRRVLRDDGTLWLNLGDSYTTGASVSSRASDPKAAGDVSRGVARIGTPAGLKPKDLIGIPWRVAFALQADGWYLRSDIIWAKPNPMPESVTDRPTKAHEYLFLLAKEERYFYDAEAIKEPMAAGSPARLERAHSGYAPPGQAPHRGYAAAPRENVRAKGNARTFRGGGAYTGNRSFDNDADVERESRGNAPNETGLRNKRSVWTVATQPFPEAHFATFPEALIEPCVLAGSRVGDLVLDPFSGSGTTGVVALANGRRYRGIERNAEYVAMSERRLARIDAWQPSLLAAHTSTNV